MIESIQSGFRKIEAEFENGYRQTARFLDKHPTLYKAALVACHFFRAAGMYGMMLASPFPLPLTLAAMTGGTLLYRASVERFCCFRFALPSLVGAPALWLSTAGLSNVVSGAAFRSLGMLFSSSLLMMPLIAYTGWVVWISNHDINTRQRPLHAFCHC